MSTEILNQHKIIWQEKPVLRAVYQDYYHRILKELHPGKTLEVGGGTGNLKQYLTHVVTTDILTTPWLDVACDAQSLPFKNNSFDNIVVMDVLHHIERPTRFFGEAIRILKTGGRLILLEPAITKMSWLFYHFLHPEPVILNIDPLQEITPNPNRQAFDANQAIPELLFGKFYVQWQKRFQALTLKKKTYLSLWVYPLSGGFRKWCLIPHFCVNFMLAVEKILESVLGKYLGFRILITLEKNST